MGITEEVRKFLKNNLELIDRLQLDKLYELFHDTQDEKVYILTEVLESIGIEPLKHMTKIWPYHYDGNAKNLVIPPNITMIGAHAFENCTTPTHLVIPEGVTKLWRKAFYNCLTLEEVSLPKSLLRIGPECFRRCRNLKIVHYAGTSEMWKMDVAKVSTAFEGTGVGLEIHCIDEVIRTMVY